MTQTTKDAEALLEAIYDCEESCHDSGMLIDTDTPKQLQIIQSALTAAEQRGFERGKADVVRPRYSGQPVLEAFDDTCVDKLAFDMKVKMDYSREVKGRSGWFDKKQCTIEQLSSMLRNHVEKGDPVDVANFCMMLHHRGERISTVTQADAVPCGSKS